MDQQTHPEPVVQKRSNRPIVALLLSLSSMFFCCVSFLVNNPNNIEIYAGNSALGYVAQALMCLAAIFPLSGAILGFLSMRAGEANRNVALASIIVGVSLFILATLIFGYVLFFIGVLRVFTP